MNSRRFAVLLGALSVLPPVLSLRAQTSVSLQTSGNWSAAGNWTPATVPSNGGGLTYNATVGGGRTATVDNDYGINDLTVGGSSSADSTVTINAGRTLTVNGSFSAGLYTQFNGGGTLTLNAAAGANSGSSGNAQLIFDNATFNNQAGSTFSDGAAASAFDTVLAHGGTINNAGTYSLDGASPAINAGTGGGTFNNTGTLRGAGYVYANIAFASSGAINGTGTGLIEFGGGGTSSGTVNTGADASHGVRFDAGTWTFTAASTNGGAGRFVVAGAAVTINGAHNVTGTTSVGSGSLTFANAGTTLAGPLAVTGGTTSFTGANTLAEFDLGAPGSGGGTASVNLGAYGTLTVNGPFSTGTYSQVNGTGAAAITIKGGGSIGSNSAFVLSGVTLGNAAGSTLTESNAGGFDNTLQNGAVINNAGTWVLQNQNGRGLVAAAGAAGAGAAFNNSGTLAANATYTSANIGFALNNTGVVRLDAGAGNGGNPTLAVGTFTQTAGSTQLAHDVGNFATLSSSNPIEFQGGSLVGSGRLVGSVVVSGAGTLVAPGYSAGTITVQGTFQQTGGMMSLELGRTAAGAVNDLVTGTATLTLTGTAVTVRLLPGSQALQVGDSFTLLSSTATGGGLAMAGGTVTLDPSLGGYTFTQTLTASAFTLTVSGVVPEPGAWAGVGLGLAGLLAGGWRRRRAPGTRCPSF